MKIEIFDDYLWFTFDLSKQYGILEDGLILREKILYPVFSFRDCL